MKAVILAGGLGTRLKEISGPVPKVLMPIGGIPIIEHQITLLARYDLRDIILSTGYGAEHIKNHCGQGKQWKVNITYSHEETPLGTGGALKLLAPQLTKDFLVLYGDVMLEMNFNFLISYHHAHHPIATLVVHPSDHPYDSDLVKVNYGGRIVGWFSKGRHIPGECPNIGNAGIGIFSPKIFSYLPEGYSSMEKNGVVQALARGEKLMGYSTAGYIKDMGTEERYRQVTADYEEGRIIAFPLTKIS